MRKTWDEYFLSIAQEVSSRATCDRAHVGAVFVRGRDLLCTGYNGALPGMPHCDDDGHEMDGNHCVATVHAEVNAVAQAAKRGICLEGCTLYCTHSPCWPCFKVVASAGAKRIVYSTMYSVNTRIDDACAVMGIELVHMEGACSSF